MFPILVRTVIVYFVLVLSIRLTGKRQVGEMQLSELITAFLISEVAASALSDPGLPLLYSILPILLLTSLEILISFLSVRIRPVKRLFEPPPTVLIAGGKLNQEELRRQRITLDELLSALRLKDVADIAALEYCFLEHNGQISAFQAGDGLTLPVIIDGSVLKRNLALLGRDENWLNGLLRRDGRKKKTLFLMTTDGSTARYTEKTETGGKTP